MKKITLLLFGLFLIMNHVEAQVAIGSGNLEAENAPFEPYYGYSYAQTIYLSSEINASGDITDIQWYYSGISALPSSQDLVIYMAESPKTEFADTDDWEPISSFTQVYSGGITVTAGTEGWVTLTLDTPFSYSGNDNLIIAVEENGDDYDNAGDDFYNSQVSTNRTISYFDDNVNPDPSTPPTANNIDDTIPNIIFGGITQACPNPGDLTATSITSDSAELSWTENGTSNLWNIEIVEDGSTPTGIATNPGVANPFPATGLTPSTNYEYYVQADCGSELSGWVGPFTFATECITAIAPFSEGFENAGEIPLCWSMDGGEDWFFSDTGAGNHIGNNGTITGSTDTNGYFAWCDSSDNHGSRTLTSPLIDVSALTTPALSFYEISDNEGNANSTLDVEVWDGAAWSNVATYNTNTSGWELKIIDLSTLTISGDIQVRFVFSETTGGDFYDDIAIDDVVVDEAPSCFNPTFLTASAITSNSAELSWTQDGTVSLWNIEIVESETPPTGTPTNTDISNPYSATGLDPVTSYDYYVQANCGGDLSGWTGPFTFETLCDVFVPDYIEQFNNIIPDCWDEAEGGDATTGPTNTGVDSGWIEDGFLNEGNTGAYKINMYGDANLNDWIISPVFDLTGGPFQVEFDFAITEWNSSDSTEPLDADDTVQLLMTNDNGATWIELLLYDSTSVVPIPGIHPVVDLTSYSGQTVQFAIFASEGTAAAAGTDVDVFVDNFRVRGIPTCPEPTDLTATNLSLTSTEVGWTEAGTSTIWNIQYGEPGFTLGTGTIEADVTTNPFILDGLDPDTEYEFYVQAVCSPGDESSYAGPFQFFTGYCASEPSSNDGDGVNNVTIGLTDFPSAGDVYYENNTSPVVNVFQGIETNVEIEFGHGITYDTYIWIDFNDDLVFDASELVYEGESPGGGNPNFLDASFIMPATAALGEHRMRIGTSDFGQTPPNPCYNGTWGVTLDFTVNVQELTCTLPEATFSTTPDCDTDSFYINVDITSIGDASSLEISNDFDANTIQAFNADTYQAGPFPFGTAAKIFVMNEQDNNCTISSDTFEVVACPPVNDNPCNATVAVVNDDILCADRTSGTILAATISGVADPSCGGDADDDVWFQFVAESENQLIALANITGSDDLDHSVYEGTCDNLTEISCTSGFVELSSVTPQLTIGETYFIRVYSQGGNNESSTFDVCITPYVAPGNITCDTADNYCSGSEASDILYTYNTIDIEPGDGTIDCLFTTPNPTYSTLEIGTTGDILIEMVQNAAFDENDNPIGDELDVDFLLWGPYDPDDDLCTLPAVVDCSYSAAPVENVTLLGAQQGEVYLLLITNFEAEAGIIQVRQTNIGDTDAGSTIADIDAEIVSDEVFIDPNNDPDEIDEVSVCGFNSVTIKTDSPFADSYVWYKDGFEMPGETSSSITVTESNNYQVQAFDSQCGSNAFSQLVIINLYKDPGTIPDQAITICDGPVADGEEEFDLDALTASLGLGPDFTVTYYNASGDPNQAIGALASPYNGTSGEILTMRIEDVEAANDNYLGCRQLAEVELFVDPRPVAGEPEDIEICSAEPSASFPLSDNDDLVLDGLNAADYTITYHPTQDDADDDTGALSSPYLSGPETIYVRLEDNNTNCYTTDSFELVVLTPPSASIDTDFFYYNETNDEFLLCNEAESPLQLTILPDGFTESEVTIQWFLDGMALSGETGLTVEAEDAGEYSASIILNSNNCEFILDNIMVTEIDSCVIPQGISPGVSPGQNDTFDLRYYNVTKLEIFNRNGSLVYSKKNYTNEWVGQTNDGEELPVGTYFYTMEYEGGTKQRSAWIYLNK